MIKDVKDILEISKCFPMEKTIIEKGYCTDNINTVLANISYQIVFNPNFHFWISYKGDVIEGYMYFNIVGNQLFIGRAWVIKWNPELLNNFKNELMKFSKINNVKSWSMNAIKRKTIDMVTGFGFKPISVIMGMEVI